MNDQSGGTTQDLLTNRQPHPSEHPTPKGGMPDTEAANRRYGHILAVAGITLAVIPFVIALVIAALNPKALDDEGRSGRILSIMLFTLITIGVVMIGVAGFERLTRYNRTLIRQVLANQADIRRDIDEVREEVRVVMGMVGPIPGRLAVIDEAVAKFPSFTEGVEVGSRMLSDLMDPRERH